MKQVKTEQPKRGVLLQVRLTSKLKNELSPYDAYELLKAALEKSPLDLLQAEFRVDDEEKTSI